MGIDQAIEDLLRPIHRALDNEGITHDYLARKLKAELEAEEVKVFKGDGNTTIESEPLVAWQVRQKARMDAHKLRGDYPAEELKLDTALTVNVVNYAETEE